MIELTIGIVTALLFSYLFLWAYRRGLKDGLALKDNKHIEPIKTPVAVVREAKQAKETKEAETTQTKFIANLFEYDGSPQKEVY